MNKIRFVDDFTEETLYENIVKAQKKKTKQDLDFIITCLKNNFVFYNLSEENM